MVTYKTLTAIAVLYVVATRTEIVNSWQLRDTKSSENWLGKWFPHDPTALQDNNPEVEFNGDKRSDANDSMGTMSHDRSHGPQMGKVDPDCDDGRTNLTVDWDNSPADYICFEDKHLYSPNYDVHPTLHISHIPKEYVARHACMNESLYYDENIPTFGMHRPLWPRYGEYTYLPKQRWLHSLEHGAVVMLYHPCANNREIKLMKSIVRNCLYRHIITPYVYLSQKYPLALVTWGTRLELSKVDTGVIVDFIKNFALHGPEQKSTDGQYSYALSEGANIVTDMEDSKICLKY